MHRSNELAGREVERALRLGENVSVLLARLDQFERVNDTWGQLTGDAVLVAVANELAGNLRTYDVAGRFGGEEFVVLLPATGPAQAVTVAGRLRDRIGALRIAVPSSEGAGLGTRTDRVTVSIGIAALPEQASDLTACWRGPTWPFTPPGRTARTWSATWRAPARNPEPGWCRRYDGASGRLRR